MDPLILSNVLDVGIIFVCALTFVRVCMVYPKVRSPRLIVLALVTVILTLGSAVDLISTNVEGLLAQTDWFIYISQAVALFGLWFSLVGNSEERLRRLVLSMVFALIILICLLVVSPALPELSNVTVRSALGSLRFIACIGIACSYIAGFIQKHSRFGFLMATCFLLLMIGYLLDSQQYLLPNYETLFDVSGDVFRLGAYAALFLGVVIG